MRRRFWITVTLVGTLGTFSGTVAAQSPPPADGWPELPSARIQLGATQPASDSSMVLAQLANESNLWVPYCEPPGPTKGLWGPAGPCSASHTHSWQEWIHGGRDCLGWLFARQRCGCDARPTSDVSAVDWLAQWLPRFGSK